MSLEMRNDLLYPFLGNSGLGRGEAGDEEKK
jgi:hypothetical protein